MKRYEHTQPAVTVLIITGAIALSFLCVGVFQKQLLIGGAVLVIISWLFRSLTIEVTETELIWKFGGGWLRKRVPLREIASVKIVRTNVLEGWGIHITRFGWLYNVSGFEAVAITLNSGKRFALGTDEAEKLASVLVERQE
jgi:hypothetical protein